MKTASDQPSLLLIEPDENDAVHFQRAFEREARHWRLTRKATGRDAIRHVIATGYPDILISRIHIGKPGTYEVVEWLRSFRDSQRVPVVIHDRRPSKAECAHWSKLNVTDFWDPCLPASQLKASLHRILLTIEEGFISEKMSR